MRARPRGVPVVDGERLHGRCAHDGVLEAGEAGEVHRDGQCADAALRVAQYVRENDALGQPRDVHRAVVGQPGERSVVVVQALLDPFDERAHHVVVGITSQLPDRPVDQFVTGQHDLCRGDVQQRALDVLVHRQWQVVELCHVLGFVVRLLGAQQRRHDVAHGESQLPEDAVGARSPGGQSLCGVPHVRRFVIE